MSTRVFLVDDHEIVRRGIADLLDDEPDLQVCGEAASVAEALARIPATSPDVAVLDVRLPDGNGVELCRELRARNPELHCLMLTSFSDDEALLDAIMAGAAGFVLKQVLGHDLLAAIRTVAGGQSLLDGRTTAALMNRLRRQRDDADPLRELSDQERTVLELIGDGLTNRQIAERMFLAEKTVKNYVSHLLAKLGMQRRTQVAVLATELRSRDKSDPGESRSGAHRM
ncbi:response regulator transcription factor [Kutzneria sp. NPDC051319]|uniref:response regulator transcription factor n=1 Tax=Kutzneria sp. NPDC051319 TaxID=3155047 RepID=UPI0034149FBE